MLKPNTPAYLKDVTFTTETIDGETRRVCKLAFRIAPFSAELAGTISDEVRRHLFRTTDGEPNDDIAEIKFALSAKLQELRIRFAVDAARDAIVLPDVKVSSTLRVRRDKETPTFEANFGMDFNYPDADSLMSLVNNINNQLVITLNDQQTDMLDEQRNEEEKKPRAVRNRRAPAAAENPEGEEGPASV